MPSALEQPIRLSELDQWPSDLVAITLAELTTNLDEFLDEMDAFLQSREARTAREASNN
jgi:hypothetical protein